MLTPMQTRTIVMESNDTKNIDRTVTVHTGLSAEAYNSSRARYKESETATFSL
jgi:hypothetical protein